MPSPLLVRLCLFAVLPCTLLAGCSSDGPDEATVGDCNQVICPDSDDRDDYPVNPDGSGTVICMWDCASYAGGEPASVWLTFSREDESSCYELLWNDVTPYDGCD